MSGRAGRPKALIYVQHLLGIGHLARVNRIAAGLIAAGVDVTVARGGDGAAFPMPVDADVIQLPPVRVESADMGALLHLDGRPFADADKDARRDMLLAALERVRPDILITEAFPFGRRAMRFELMPLLEQAREMAVPVVAASIRDILQESRKPGRAEETAELVERYYDLVLVHGDEDATPLSLTFPLATRIQDKVRHTGIVGPRPPQRTDHPYAVVVSAGGGVVGAALLQAAIRALPMTAFRDRPMLVLAGPNLPSADFDRLAALAASISPLIELRRSVPDLPAMLAGAAMSVSQAGYNTVADILAAGCSAVLSPFADGGETEQAARADALGMAGRAAIVPADRLTPENVAGAIDIAAALPKPSSMRLPGASRTAELLLAALADRRRRVPYGSSRVSA